MTDTVRVVETMGGSWDYTDQVNFRDRAALAILPSFISAEEMSYLKHPENGKTPFGELCKQAYHAADTLYKVRMETLPHCKADDEPLY